MQLECQVSIPILELKRLFKEPSDQEFKKRKKNVEIGGNQHRQQICSVFLSVMSRKPNANHPEVKFILHLSLEQFRNRQNLKL